MSDLVLLNLDARGVATLTLNRAEKRNAFDAALIARLHERLLEAETDAATRVVVLTGSGSAFSAGADLAHMRKQGTMSEQENFEDALAFAKCLETMDGLCKPLIARVNGGAYGGGVGLIACADIAIGAKTAKFALTEVRLGIVPAVISPYVVNAIGGRQARRWFLTGMPLDAEQAREIGLLHEVTASELLDEAVDRYVTLLLQAGPEAQSAAKQLIRDVTVLPKDKLAEHTARLLAKLRSTPEGKEGLTAFLENRKPGWIKE